jgi:hypothetical protein
MFHDRESNEAQRHMRDNAPRFEMKNGPHLASVDTSKPAICERLKTGHIERDRDMA